MPELDLGTIVARIRLDAELLEQVADRAVEHLRKVGEQGLASQKKLDATSAALNKTGQAGVGMASNLNAATGSIKALDSAASSGNLKLDKLSYRIEKASNDFERQRQVVAGLSAALDSTTDQYAALEKAAGRGTDFDIAAIFPQQTAHLDKEIAKMDELRRQLQILQQERAAAATVAEQSAARQVAAAEQAAVKQELLNQKMADKSARVNAGAGIDAVAMSIRGVTSAAGGAVGGLGYLATEVAFLKRSMNAATDTATKFAIVMSVGVMAAVTIVTGVINAVREAEEKRQKVFEEGVENLKKYGQELYILESSLRVLKDQRSSTDELTAARNNLTGTFSSLIVGYDKEGNAISANVEAIERLITAKKKEAKLTREAVIASGKGAEQYEKQKEKIQEIERILEKYKDKPMRTRNEGFISWDAPNFVTEEQLVEAKRELLKISTKYQQELNYEVESLIRVKDATSGLIKGFDDLDNKQSAVANNMKLNLIDSLLDGNYTAEEFQKKLKEGGDAINAMLNDDSKVLAYYNKLVGAMRAATQNVESQVSSLTSLQSAYASLSSGQQLNLDQLYQMAQAYPEIAAYLAENGDLSLDNGKIIAKVYEIKRQVFIAEQKQHIRELEMQREKQETALETARVKIEALKAEGMIAAQAIAGSPYADEAAAQKEIDAINNQINQANALIKTLEKIDVTGTGSSTPADKRSEALAKELSLLEHKKRMNEFTAQQELDALQRIQKTFTMNAEERRDIEYRIYSAKKQMEEAAEKAASDALAEQYQLMENRKALGKLTAQEELSWLERIRAQYKANAEERMALEIKIYNLQRSLRDEDIGALDKLGSAVTAALKARYDEQRKAEEQRIRDSIDGWKTWEKDTVAAIQGQIDALDELEREQDSAEKRAEYERKKQALDLQIAYEKDAYQKKQLQQELARLDTEEQKRLEKEARDELKRQLQAQIDAAKESSQAQQDALQDQLDSVKDRYEQMTSELALRAQAEKAIMTQSQNELVNLIKSYAPEYDMAGQSLGERLVAGFSSKVQDIVGFVDSIAGKIQAHQKTLSSIATQAADNFWRSRAEYERQISNSSAPAVQTVNLTVNFNTPVESPIEAQRALESAAAELARKIQQGG